MSKYKAGDKVVLEIREIDHDDSKKYVVKKEGCSFLWWSVGISLIDKYSKPLSEYTEKLELENQNEKKKVEELDGKIRRQAAEITRLLAENAELKKDLEYYQTGTDTCDIESARAAGQREAWKLALKLRYMDYEDKVECFGLGYDGKEKWIEVMENYTYAEAAAKVAEWERKKKEICVGDVVECEEHYGVVVGVGEYYIKGFTSDWTPFQWMKKGCTKTGRHIDVDAWMAQIGGGSDE